MKAIIFFVVISFSTLHFLNAQDEVWQQIIEQKVPTDYRMSASLYQIGKYAEYDAVKAWQKVKSMKMWCNDADKTFNIEIIYKDIDDEIDKSFIESIESIKADAFWKNRASVWIKVEDILRISQSLPDDYFMQMVSAPGYDDEGPLLQNSQSYINGGKDGSGIKIAIIDSGFDSLTEAQLQSTAPLSITTKDYIGSGIQSGSEHGTGCLETVYDHAPGAQYFIYRVGNPTHTGNAVNDAINNGVNVISHSQSEYNTGWDDDTGPACAAAKNASDNGILFFTSAGNRARTHYKNAFSDNDNDNFHEWSGSDENNYINIDTGASVNFHLSWNNSSYSDYDFRIVDSATGTVLATSNSFLGFEEITGYTPVTNNKNLTVSIQVKHFAGAKPVFELFAHVSGIASNLQYFTSGSSTTSPSNSTAANVISVGAVSRTRYDTMPGVTGIIASYSSQGPTNSNNQAPDIVAPTNTTTWAYGGSFGGTSCATPNAAGMAAAFWSAHPYLSSTGVRLILFRKAELYKDWGVSGADNIYGVGGVYLYDYYNNTRYLYRAVQNLPGLSFLPYHFAADAQNATPAGGRVVILGQQYPEPIMLNKKLIWISLMENAGIGY